jgi:CHASE3 domain sensor protein
MSRVARRADRVSVGAKAAAGLAAGMLILGGVGAAAFLSMDRLRDASRSVSRAERVLRESTAATRRSSRRRRARGDT